jgi:hypothetical protein
MEMTYWTTLVESKECRKAPFKCPKSEYEKLFEADVTLKNVNVNSWAAVYDGTTKKDSLEIRFAFDQYQAGNSDF